MFLNSKTLSVFKQRTWKTGLSSSRKFFSACMRAATENVEIPRSSPVTMMTKIYLSDEIKRVLFKVKRVLKRFNKHHQSKRSLADEVTDFEASISDSDNSLFYLSMQSLKLRETPAPDRFAMGKVSRCADGRIIARVEKVLTGFNYILMTQFRPSHNSIKSFVVKWMKIEFSL